MKTALVMAPGLFIRPKNTDWRQLKMLEQHLGPMSGRWRAHMRWSLAALAGENLGYASRAIRQKFFRKALDPRPYRTALLRGDQAERFDAIYAYGTFPTERPDRPIVWHCGPSDPDVLKAAGWSTAEIGQIIADKQQCLLEADVAVVSSPHARQAMIAQYGQAAAGTIVLPFLLPYVDAATIAEIERKHSEGPLRVLFVGREAVRKGLKVVLEACARAVDQGCNLHLTVISSFQDGHIDVPRADWLTVLGEQDADSVKLHMRKAHVFCMPSLRESYGIVYVEAMAAGAIPIARDAEPQRTLLANGEVGRLLKGDAQELAAMLHDFAEDPIGRVSIALRARSAFEHTYAPEVVIATYSDILDRAVEVWRAKGGRDGVRVHRLGSGEHRPQVGKPGGSDGGGHRPGTPDRVGRNVGEWTACGEQMKSMLVGPIARKGLS